MSIKSILKMAMVTVGVMWGLNQLAAMNPMARKLIKGASVAPVSTGGGLSERQTIIGV